MRLRFKEYYFTKALKDLKKAGAKMVVYEETWGMSIKNSRLL